jgi:hypothetical protein
MINTAIFKVVTWISRKNHYSLLCTLLWFEYKISHLFMVQGIVPSWWCYCGVVETLRVVLSGRTRLQEACFSKTYCHWSLLVSPFIFCLPQVSSLLYYTLFAMILFLITGHQDGTKHLRNF